MKRNTIAVWAMVALGAAGSVQANNLQITNVTVTGRDETTAWVEFDIAWDNSWRYAGGGDPPYFHDAAWVFFKVLPDGQTDWQHVTLEGAGTNPTNYVVGSGTPIEIVVPADRVGMVVRRSGEGAGTTAVQGVKAVWNFASNSLATTDKVKLQAFGVEMVFVAEGTNTVGDGTSSTIYAQFEAGTSGMPFAITNEAYAITLGGGGAGSLGNNNATYMLAADDFKDSTTQTLPAPFPKGYAAFYCMKYEITEGQWVDFFNTLTDTQKSTRDITGFHATYQGKNSDGVTNRNTVAWTGGDATTARRDRACGYLCWADVCAFADWAGLRPMTELEFEKACRGPLTPVANEYAWGTATIMADASRTISGAENGTETITSDTSAGGCNYGISNKVHTSGDGGTGPLRAGIFAVNGATRAAAGASYWGIMELSGNVWERTVTVGKTDGRNFTGLHGNGVLTTDGEADVSAWPGTSASGGGFRGGSWFHNAMYERASARSDAAHGHAWRTSNRGGRAVRSAP